MKRPILFIACLLAATAYSLHSADPPKPSQSTRLTPLMQMKLEKSKAILEGLTLENYEQIAKNGRTLKLLSMESGWNVIQTAEYTTQSKDFSRACDLIIAAAEDQDINRATLGYIALTVRCVECHSYMRKHNAELRTLETSESDSTPTPPRVGSVERP